MPIVINVIISSSIKANANVFVNVIIRTSEYTGRPKRVVHSFTQHLCIKYQHTQQIRSASLLFKHNTSSNEEMKNVISQCKQ